MKPKCLPLLSPVCLLLVSLAPGALAAPGVGLLAEYFDNADFTTLRLTTTNATVNFDWGAGVPAPGMGADTFSVRWSGQLEPQFSETHTFIVTADDGARLWVNDKLIAARTFGSVGAPELTAQLALKAGRRVNLRLEYLEQTGNARVKLEWASPSQPREVIPQSRLHPVWVDAENGTLLAETWLGLPGGSLAPLTNAAGYPLRPEAREFLTSFESFHTNWADAFGTRVTGYLVPPVDGDYVFAVAADDAAELRLSPDAVEANKALIAAATNATGFRQWSNHLGQISAPRALVAGRKYFVELLHKEAAGQDHFAVAWRRPGGDTFEVIAADFLVPAGLTTAAPAKSNFFNTLAPAHPRLLASAQRFDWLKREVAANPGGQPAQWYAAVRNAADATLGAALPAYNPDVRGTILSVSRSVVDHLYKLALAWRVSGNAAYAERAWSELEAAAGFPDWHPAHFLDTAEMTHAFALGYDWLYEYWTPARRATLRAALVNQGLTPGLSQYTGNAGWTRSDANNWNLVCNGGLSLGALALGTDEEALAEDILSRAVASAAPVMRRFTADNGAWYEGPGYWGYSTEYNTRMLPALESALGSSFGLSQTRGLADSGAFALLVVGPQKKSFNFADAGAGNLQGPQMFWYALRFNAPLYAWHQRANASPHALDALWHDPRGADPATEGLPPDLCFRGAQGATPFKTVELVTMRSAWNNGDASFLAFHGGEMGASHGNLDAGSFVFDARGVRWAHDLGGDNYALPGYFGSERWTYYRLRAEGHNTLVINPGSGADMLVGPVAPVLFFSSQPDGGESASIVDLTPVYSGVTRVWRGFQLRNNRRDVLVQDEITTVAPATVWWFMHVQTNANPVVAPDGLSAMLTQGTDRLYVRLLTSNAVFTLRDAAPLPTSPNPAGQATNSNYRKLALQLSGVTTQTLAVLLAPLTPGQAPPATFPELKPLAEWSGGAIVPPATNTPPATVSTSLVAVAGSVLEFDLRALARDHETASPQLVFSVFGATNGSVVLLPDRHTARFTVTAGAPALAGFNFSVLDAWPEASLAAAYDFEPPEDLADGLVNDRSGRGFDGAVSVVGAGAASLVSDAPAVLQPLSAQALRLVEAGDFHGARLGAPLSAVDLPFTQQDWTVSLWFKRASSTNDDFLFYLGSSDGFGSPDELQLYCPSGQSTLALRHYIAQNTTDVDLWAPGVAAGQWRHAAVVFDSTNANQGTMSLYLDGAIWATDPAVALNLSAGYSAIFGGHASSTFAVTRWCNGSLDDAAIFRRALSGAEIARLAARPVAWFGGTTVTNTVQVSVVPVNLPPTLAAPANRTLLAGATLLATNAAADPNAPPQQLRFTLLSAPAGALISPDTGVISWRPAIAAAGTSNWFTVVVTEDGWSTNLAPLADACVRDGSWAGMNFGADTNLTVKLGSAGLSRESFLRFDAPTLPGTLAAATLRLMPVAANVPATQLLAFVADDAWSEATLTWSTRPASGPPLAAWTVQAGAAVELSLNDLVRQEQAGDGLLSLRLFATNQTADGRVDYAAREAAADGPRLALRATNYSTFGATQGFWVVVTAPRQPTLGSPIRSNGVIGIWADGDAGPDYLLQTSTNLLDWVPLQTLPPAVLPVWLSDTNDASVPQRFYRVQLGP